MRLISYVIRERDNTWLESVSSSKRLSLDIDRCIAECLDKVVLESESFKLVRGPTYMVVLKAVLSRAECFF